MFEKNFEQIQRQYPVGQRIELTRDWAYEKKGSAGKVTHYFAPPDCLVFVLFDDGVQRGVNGDQVNSLLKKI